MIETMIFAVEEAAPDKAAVYENQGIPPGHGVHAGIEALYESAVALFQETAAPAGVMAEVSTSGFEAVYAGEGANDDATPVADIFPRAERLALFAVTLGERISMEIDARFLSDDFALAAMLDSVASVAADRLAEHVGRRFLSWLAPTGAGATAARVLTYSPGYCGWHVSGQKKLFEVLRPQRIGVTLNDSCLMQPLKSVSGVILAGPAEIHGFEDSYACCTRCDTRDCRERIRALLEE